MKFIFTFCLQLLISLLIINMIKCDLPIHCLKHDIIGNWVIKATDIYPVESGHQMKCGHSEPSNEDTSYRAKSPYDFKHSFKINLKENNEASIDMEGKLLQGSWTMVYDEGFNINFNQFTFFAFNKYIIDEENGKKSFKSQCYSTCVGWYNNKDKTKWGCYQAFKIGVNSKQITTYNSKNNLNIVEPTSSLNDDILNSMMNMQFKSIGSIITFGGKEKKNKLQRKNFLRKGDEDRDISEYEHSSFLEEKEFAMMKLDASFNKHALYISKLNTIKKSWNAALHPNFSNMSIRQLNKFAGIPRLANKFRFKSRETVKPLEDVSMFPKNFDWKDKLKPAGSQGNCGSCYVYSTMRMIEARLKILYNHDVNLSVQHALDCSFYNQGCNGGYPFLVMKFANEFELIPENCKPYKELDGKCDENFCDLKDLPYIYKATDYRYIGGSYGDCSQKKMMEEVFKNGPVVVSFEPDYNFMMYKSGIYHSFDDMTWLEKGMPKPEWVKVDHSVLLVGWGEDETTGEKFWIIQNTWGPNWGEDGFFRMKRGSDEYGIESICEVATPLMINNQTKQIITPAEFISSKLNPTSLNTAIQNGQISDPSTSIFDVFK